MATFAERAIAVGESVALVATTGALVGGVYICTDPRPYFHRHVIAAAVIPASVAGLYLGIREVLIAGKMQDSAPTSAMAGIYASTIFLVATGTSRPRILPWAMLSGAAAGAANVGYARVQQSKWQYVRALPVNRQPSLGDWFLWAITPTKRDEWAHSVSAQLDWLLYGSDIIEMRRRLAEKNMLAPEKREPAEPMNYAE
ncbi:hypothetical protein T492DRAFT_1109694 [Pavlovales sp. CCMP2436]|nr:hypothetical protein T492DRAFT_1109694 [Pavlovales sp. CCMP2436]